MSEDDVAGVGEYEGAAAGWGALKAVADAVRGQMAAWLRLPRLRLARSQTYLLVRVLRERRQGCRLGGDRQTDDAGILCGAYGQRTLELAGLRSRERGSPDPPDGLRPGN